jgi:hypothetical protein
MCVILCSLLCTLKFCCALWWHWYLILNYFPLMFSASCSTWPWAETLPTSNDYSDMYVWGRSVNTNGAESDSKETLRSTDNSPLFVNPFMAICMVADLGNGVFSVLMTTGSNPSDIGIGYLLDTRLWMRIPDPGLELATLRWPSLLQAGTIA